jgi:hypothetical protein
MDSKGLLVSLVPGASADGGDSRAKLKLEAFSFS